MSDVTAAGPSKLELAMLHAMHDRTTTFEEYVYWAKITRAEEKAADEHYRSLKGQTTVKSAIMDRFSMAKNHSIIAEDKTPAEPLSTGGGIKQALDGNGTGNENEKLTLDRRGDNQHAGVTDAEWTRASRAVRTAGWGGVFYLITTDILGPFSTP